MEIRKNGKNKEMALKEYVNSQKHCPDSARTQGANERVVLCLMNELVAGNERVL